MSPLFYSLFACSEPVCGVDQDVLPRDDELLFQHRAVLDLRLESDELEGLKRSSEESAPDIHATLLYEDDAFDVGLKLKGTNSFRTIDGKAALKIDVGEFEDGQTFYGVRRLTLNNMVQDASQLAEALAYRLFDAAGVPAPRHGYACVAVNDEPMGLYSVIETMDEQFVDRAFGDDGTLWEGHERSDFVGKTFQRFELEEGEEEHIGVMGQFIRELDDTAPDDYLDLLDVWTERDALLSMWAVDALIGNYDSYSAYNHNYLVYYSPVTGRFSMIPWGVDLAFTRPLDPLEMDDLVRRGRLFQDCLASTPCTDAYLERVAEVAVLLEEMDLEGYGDGLRDQLSDSHSGEAREEYSGGEIRRARRRVLRYVRQQPDRTMDAIP